MFHKLQYFWYETKQKDTKTNNMQKKDRGGLIKVRKKDNVWYSYKIHLTQ